MHWIFFIQASMMGAMGGKRSRAASEGASGLNSSVEEEEDDGGGEDGGVGSVREEKGEDDTQPPLQWATLTGKQELVVRFSDTNQFGLPRSLDEVELNLGGLFVHLFPHQVSNGFHCRYAFID